MANILRKLGVKIIEKNNKLKIDSQNISIKELPYELVNGLRASFFCIGPLLSKFGEAKVPLPGGCNIGSRPIDEHIKGLKALGAEILIEEEIVSSLREKKETLLKKISAKLVSEEKVSEELAINSAKEGFEEVERLLANHSEAV